MSKNTDNAQTCLTCGAIVDQTKVTVHTRWHEAFEKRVLEIVRKEATETSRRRSTGGLT